MLVLNLVIYNSLDMYLRTGCTAQYYYFAVFWFTLPIRNHKKMEHLLLVEGGTSLAVR